MTRLGHCVPLMKTEVVTGRCSVFTTDSKMVESFTKCGCSKIMATTTGISLPLSLITSISPLSLLQYHLSGDE